MNQKNQKRQIFIGAIVGVLGVVYIGSSGVQHLKDPTLKSLIGVLGPACIVLMSIGLLVFSKLGLALRSDSYKRRFVDFAHELPHAWQPVVQDIANSFGGRPAVGGVGLVVTAAISWLVLMWWPGHSTALEKVGIFLGVAGMLFGILAYHAALGVERSIRDSITDFRQFLKATEDILEGEILFERKKLNKFDEASEVEGQPTAVADLILLLWFPYYGLTKDFNQVGPSIGRQLRRVQKLACRTYLITAEDPLGLMLHYDGAYSEASKRYDPDALKRIAKAIGGATYADWERLIENEIVTAPSMKVTDSKVAKVLECVDDIKELIHPATSRFWTVSAEDNDTLMKGLVQVVWTGKKAAIIFMPPEGPRAAVPTEGEVYKCSGFVTSDPFMLRMIRDLIHIRFSI